MYGLKTTTSLFRPSSRPTSPTPVTRTDAPLAAERVARPLSKLSLASFRRPSPSPASVPTAPPSTVVQDGSFMEVLSLKLSEAVSKALAQPAGPAAPGESLAGRRPIPAGRGRALGILIVSYVLPVVATCRPPNPPIAKSRRPKRTRTYTVQSFARSSARCRCSTPTSPPSSSLSCRRPRFIAPQRPPRRSRS